MLVVWLTIHMSLDKEDSTAGFLSLSTVDIMGQILFVVGGHQCLVRCLAASLAFYSLSPHLPVVTTQNIARYC